MAEDNILHVGGRWFSSTAHTDQSGSAVLSVKLTIQIARYFRCRPFHCNRYVYTVATSRQLGPTARRDIVFGSCTPFARLQSKFCYAPVYASVLDPAIRGRTHASPTTTIIAVLMICIKHLYQRTARAEMCLSGYKQERKQKLV